MFQNQFTLRLSILILLFSLSTGGCSTDSPSNAVSDLEEEGTTAIDPTWSPECANDLEHFEEKLWRPFLSFQCRACHSSDGIAQDTRLLLHPEHTQQNFEMLWSLAQIDTDSGPLLLIKPSGESETGHTGGDLIPPNSLHYQALAHWVGRARQEIPCDVHETDEANSPNDNEPQVMEPGPRVLRRLSHLEYENTIRDLFPSAANLEFSLAPDNVVEGFRNDVDALSVSPLLADQYRELAEEIAQLATQYIQSHASCEPEQSGASQCVTELLATTGTRIFRRPLTQLEAQSYFDLWYAVAAEDGYLVGLQWMLTAMLQSPHFLYRSELGMWQGDGVYQLSPFEIATELSYSLLGTTPDQNLLNAAQNGTLETAEQVMEQASRLLGQEGAADQFWQFMQIWLGLEKIQFVTRSAETYPTFTPDIRGEMLGQTQRLTREVFHGGAFKDLLRNDTTYLTESLAEFYGVEPGTTEPDHEGFRPVSQNENYSGGILTEGAFLTTYGKPSGSSPIHRGVVVRERLLCQTLPPPPANLDTSPPAMDLSRSTRERYAEHASNPACSGCHDLIDPIGFTFEHFDGVGRYRETEGIHAVDARGEITHTASSDRVLDGAASLSEALSQSKDVARCFTKEWMRFVYGFHDEQSLLSTQDSISSQFETGEEDLQSQMLAMVQTPHFRWRAVDSDLDPVSTPTEATSWSTADLLGNRPELNPVQESVSSPPTGLDIDLVEASRWNSGACFDVHVENASMGPIAWEVEIPLEGTLANIWSAQVSQNLVQSLVVHGLSWNATLAPGDTTSFGYCVNF